MKTEKQTAYSTRPEYFAGELERLQNHFHLGQQVKRILVAGNTKGRLTVRLSEEYPSAYVRSISTNFDDADKTRNRRDKRKISDKRLTPIESGLQLFRERGEDPFDLVVFHPHLQDDAGCPKRLHSALVRACTNLAELLSPHGVVVVLALNPREHLTREYQQIIQRGFLVGFGALDFAITHTSLETLQTYASMDDGDYEHEKRTILQQYVLVVAQKS